MDNNNNNNRFDLAAFLANPSAPGPVLRPHVGVVAHFVDQARAARNAAIWDACKDA